MGDAASTAEIEYFEINGCRCAVRLMGSGRPLLALHGLTSDGEGWTKIFARAQIEGVRLIAPDARGHGLSSVTTDPADYELTAHTRDLLELLARLGHERVTIVGFSMGARIGAHIASRFPRRVIALGLYAPPPHRLDFAPARVFVNVSRDINELGFDAAVARLKQVQPGLAQALGGMNRLSAAPAIGGFHAPGFEPSDEELRAIRCPAIVMGIEDDPHPLETARFYAERIPGAEYRQTRAADRDRDGAQLIRDLLALGG